MVLPGPLTVTTSLKRPLVHSDGLWRLTSRPCASTAVCTATVATTNAAENRAMGGMAPPQKFELLLFENAARLSGMRFVIGPWTSMAYLHLHARVLRPRASRAPAQAPLAPLPRPSAMAGRGCPRSRSGLVPL